MKLTWWDGDEVRHTMLIPEHLMTYVQPLGLEKAAHLFQKFGGSPVYIAKSPKSRSSLVQELGREPAIALGAVLNGHVRIPLATEFLCRFYNSQGVSTVEIARRVRVSDVTVRSYLFPRGHAKRRTIVRDDAEAA